jgi:hypothetical protein
MNFNSFAQSLELRDLIVKGKELLRVPEFTFLIENVFHITQYAYLTGGTFHTMKTLRPAAVIFRQGQTWNFILFTTASRPDLGPTQHKWIPGAPTPGVNGWDVKLTTHLHLVPSLKTRGATPLHSRYIFMAWFLFNHRDNFIFP